MSDDEKVVKLLDDNPLENYEDLFPARQNLVDTLSEAIKKLDCSKNSFTIGLVGEWGCGKTSIFNAMKENYFEKEENIITMDFNPWYFENEYSLITSFFEEMYRNIDSEISKSEKLKKDVKNELKALGNLFNKYGNLVGLATFATTGNPLSFKVGSSISTIIGNSLKDYGSENNSIQELKNKLITHFKKLDIKIVIFIDDLDRLTGNEIKLMFKLVKSLADFPNVVYVLGYDKKIVSKALSDVQCSPEYIENNNKRILNNELGDEYIKKIVQVEYTVPEITKNELFNYFFEKIYFEYPEFNNCTDIRFNHEFEVLYELNNRRDFIRLYNTFSFEYNIVRNEVNPFEFLALSILKYHYKELYDIIYENIELLICSKDPYTRGYSISSLEDNSSKNPKLSKINEYIAELLKKLENTMNIKEKDILIEFLDFLFICDFLTEENNESIDYNVLSTNDRIEELHNKELYKYCAFDTYNSINNPLKVNTYFKLNNSESLPHKIFKTLSHEDKKNSADEIYHILKDTLILNNNLKEHELLELYLENLQHYSEEMVHENKYFGLLEFLSNIENYNIKASYARVMDTLYDICLNKFPIAYKFLINKLKNNNLNKDLIEIINRLNHYGDLNYQYRNELNNIIKIFSEKLSNYDYENNMDEIYILIESWSRIDKKSMENYMGGEKINYRVFKEYLIQYIREMMREYKRLDIVQNYIYDHIKSFRIDYLEIWLNDLSNKDLYPEAYQIIGDIHKEIIKRKNTEKIK
ncbi:GTPase SAR1 family protein [Methanococcus voltae]|uniref:GTPase SAR1 family protein n=1 Tax=Methanococcus voltae TaxID=2188 RepID=A0A8J7US77_METVO|nr:P-loop NTPase fold protein [Methanococcus voltae]MBP2201357.1 GTPase SAR1 family protein [Methanococcus voltae]